MEKATAASAAALKQATDAHAAATKDASAQHAAALETLTTEHAAALKAATDQIASLKREQASLIDEHDRALAAKDEYYVAAHSGALAAKDEQHRAAVDEVEQLLNSKHEAVRASLERRLKDDTEALARRHAEELARDAEEDAVELQEAVNAAIKSQNEKQGLRVLGGPSHIDVKSRRWRAGGLEVPWTPRHRYDVFHAGTRKSSRPSSSARRATSSCGTATRSDGDGRTTGSRNSWDQLERAKPRMTKASSPSDAPRAPRRPPSRPWR